MFRVSFLILIAFVTGFSAYTCRFYVELKQDLLNEGFHRNITYSLAFDNLEPYAHEGCIVVFVQTLPAGVFVNPDELAELKRMNKLSAVAKNPVNVEVLTEFSDPSSVYIISNLIHGEAYTWLPVHARYHFATSEGGYATNVIKPPIMYLKCPDSRLEHCGEETKVIDFPCIGESHKDCSSKRIPMTVLTKPLIFKVPVGNTSDYNVVTTLTALVVITGSLYLLKTLHEYKIKKKTA